ncbi:conserved hypothetical protein [Pseudarthrobacter chlorophenolicus A6]|uniref:DUF2848 domain-containing protein n=1 Tax=Pseudarthrobacter chlorophenolicus (strain ATCC 700700 / DSM 12829 / CIP 107037 / JCM 12360 / KCTC 9906 / NCIMB 13794 / A6) TaxID=452863 RepID=B8HG07_PSECP|nr:DUF2848 domain-containing protein [Pseudarthrobacter chlorophenolicus]ACL41200.1 conserved hypothetical protein [Pseudarthrobacter chlorophenolicus A6]SDQ68384.1 Protein of unknown function [Pseudarthrobacter chlorophenolicus]
MTVLSFELPDGSTKNVQVNHLLNAGYAGREQDEVQAHIAELAELGVPGPATTPALYPVSPYLAQQVREVRVQHARTSGEAEWALVITDEGVLLTVACDHTDRELEVHGVAWSKNASPDVLGRKAWWLQNVRDHLDQITLKGWVGDGETPGTLIQDSSLEALLTPDYWLEVLSERGLNAPGTVLISGTVAMNGGVNQFARSWKVEMADPVTGLSVEASYVVEQMPEPIG